MPNDRKSFQFTIRVQMRNPRRKAIYDWIKSHDDEMQRDLICQAVELIYRTYGAEYEGFSQKELWQAYHLTKNQVDNFFYNTFITHFGYEEAKNLPKPDGFGVENQLNKEVIKDDQRNDNDEDDEEDEDLEDVDL